MHSTFDFCLPTKSTSVPDSPDWLHEIKYDGYRLRVERDGNGVRLITRNGHNWTHRFPWIDLWGEQHRLETRTKPNHL